MDEILFARVVEQYGRIVEAQIKMEGMKAENEWNRINEISPNYKKDHFDTLANDVWNAYTYLQGCG